MNQQEEIDLRSTAVEILAKRENLTVDDLKMLRECTAILPSLGPEHIRYRMELELLLSLERLDRSIGTLNRSSSRLMFVAIAVGVAGIFATVAAGFR